MTTFQALESATSICTMSHETISDIQRHDTAIKEAAEKVDCGLITFAEAKRAIFQA